MAKAAADGLEEAEEMLASLTTAKIKGEGRLRELNATRAELAYAGLSASGTAIDRRRLVEATEAACLLQAELDNLGFAIVTAKKRVDEARGTVDAEAIRLRAEKAQQYVADWRRHGSRAASLLQEFLEAYDQAIAAANAVRRLRICRFPSHEVIETAAKSAIQNHLYPRHLHPQALLTPPGSRRELADVIELFAGRTEIELDRVINGEAAPYVEPVEVDELPPPPPRIEGEEWLEPDPVIDQAAE